MKILVVGGGGREHALIWKIKQSPLVSKIFCAPGSAGISELAECINLNPTDITKLADFAKKEKCNLTVVGPEVPLTLGIVDKFEKKGLRIFGPNKAAAQIEGSKTFSKNLMKKYNIPTGYYQTFTLKEEADRYIDEVGPPLVVKADGLAAGKGVFICLNIKEAKEAIKLIMEEKIFGDAGDRVIIEEYLEGEEASFLAFADGNTILPMVSSQDHKAIHDGDTGPNTGGMGAYSPAPIVTPQIHDQVMKKIMIPLVKGMAAEGKKYKGILYAGLMINQGKAKVLEINARFGDPETQPILMRMKSDLVPILEAVVDENLAGITIDWEKDASVCVVIASGGYPSTYEKGKEIKGLDLVAKMKGVTAFHAGTALKDGKFISNGGRVLGITSLGKGIKQAIEKAYKAVEEIDFDKMYYRTDIGEKALR